MIASGEVALLRRVVGTIWILFSFKNTVFNIQEWMDGYVFPSYIMSDIVTEMMFIYSLYWISEQDCK